MSPTGRTRRRWKDITEMDFEEIVQWLRFVPVLAEAVLDILNMELSETSLSQRNMNLMVEKHNQESDIHVS
jgi:hypothetical protein